MSTWSHVVSVVVLSAIWGQVTLARDFAVVPLSAEEEHTLANMVQQKLGGTIASISAIRLGEGIIDATVAMVPDRHGIRWESYLVVGCLKRNDVWACEKVTRNLSIRRGEEKHTILELQESTSEEEAVRVFDLCWERAAIRAVAMKKQGSVFEVDGVCFDTWAGPGMQHSVVAKARLGEDPFCRREREIE